MKKIYSSLLVVFTILCLLPIKVNAEKCTEKFKQTIWSRANSIELKYQLLDDSVLSEDDKKSNTRFKIYVSGLTDDIILEEENTHRTFTNKDYQLEKVSGGFNYKFHYFYAGSECDLYKIKDKILTVPYYNDYWDDEICKNYSKLSVCQPTTKQKVTYEYLKAQIDKYNNSKNNNTVEINSNSNNNLNIKLYLTIGISIILVLFIIIFVIKMKKRKRGIKL